MSKLKAKLFSLVKFFFNEEINAEKSISFRLGVDEQRETSFKRRSEIKRIEIEMMIGKPVIYISNEWNDPIVGFGINTFDIGTSCVLVIKDYITGKDLTVMSTAHNYSETLLNAVLKFNPFEAGSMIYRNHDWSYEHEKYGEYSGEESLREKLKSSGFFEDLKKYEETKNGNSSD